MLKNRPVFLLFWLIAVVFCSCNKGVLYQKYYTIPHNVWDMHKPVTFTVPVTDTINHYDVYVNIRNADSYDFSNLYLFIDITSPAHITERDTMECILADNSGKWLGRGLGDIWDNKILFKRNVRFPRSGNYIFTYTQAMRIDSLPLIMDVGLRIEKAPEPGKN